MSSFNTSMRSQNHRLKTILSNNNMLENSEIVPKEDIDDEDKIEISEILNYFERNHSLEDVKYLPKDFEIHNMKMYLVSIIRNPIYIQMTTFL